MKLVAALLITAAGLVGSVELLDVLAPVASQVAAESSIGSVVSTARYDTLLNGTDWAAALAAVDAQLLDGEITVDGTTVTHEDGVGCWRAVVPTASSPVQVVACEVVG